MVYPACLYFLRTQDFQEQEQHAKPIGFNRVLLCVPTDFCGPPKSVPHASIRLPQKHLVGQVLHFKCQTGYDKRPPTSGNRTCKEENGKIIWTHLDMRCTNDSNQWPPEAIGPGKMVVITPQQCPDLLMWGSESPTVVGRVGASKKFTKEALPLRGRKNSLCI